MGGEGLEGLAGAAQVRAVVSQVGEQGQVVPGSLEGREPLPVLDNGRHPFQKLLFLVSHDRTAQRFDNRWE